MASFITEAYFLNYFSIVTASQARLLDLFAAGNTATPAWQDFHSSVDGEATVTVVFTTIVLESYILNYASRSLGGEFAEKKIDRMSLVRKWIEVPRLVNGVGIPEDSEAMKLLGATRHGTSLDSPSKVTEHFDY